MKPILLSLLFVFAFTCRNDTCAQERLIGSGLANNGPIFEVNQSTGEESEIGRLGAGIRDLASDSRTGFESLWGINRDSLFRLNQNNLNIISEVDLVSAESFQTLAISPIDGRFFATSTDTSDQLFEIQPQTGVVTLIGDLDTSYDGLAFDNSGQLFGLTGDSLTTIDLVTADETTVASSLQVSSLEGDIAFRKSDNALFVAANRSEGYSLSRIDIINGTTELVGTSIIRPSGLAFVAVLEPIDGDFDADGDVDGDDVDFYIGNLNQSATGDLAQLDLNGDGNVTIADHDLHVTTLVVTTNGVTGALLGDVNLDGEVDVLSDGFTLVGSLGQSVTSHSQGDLNADGVVTVLRDAFILVGELGQSNAP